MTYASEELLIKVELDALAVLLYDLQDLIKDISYALGSLFESSTLTPSLVTLLYLLAAILLHEIVLIHTSGPQWSPLWSGQYIGGQSIRSVLTSEHHDIVFRHVYSIRFGVKSRLNWLCLLLIHARGHRRRNSPMSQGRVPRCYTWTLPIKTVPTSAPIICSVLPSSCC